MIRLILAMATICFLVAGCGDSTSGTQSAIQANSVASRSDNREVVKSASKQTPTFDTKTQQTQDGENLPPVVFDPPSLDLGELRPGESSGGTVQIRNESTKTLKIEASRASCSCTAIDLANTLLGPGESVPLSAEFSTTRMGRKKSTVRVKFEGYDMIELPIWAFVTLPVAANPAYINALPDRNGNQTFTGEYTVMSIDDRPFQILAVNGGRVPFVDFDPETDEVRTRYRLSWDLSEYSSKTCLNSAGNSMPGWIAIETDHPECPIFDVEVRHDCVRRPLFPQTDQWIIPDRRVLAGAFKPGISKEIEVETKWFPKRQQTDVVQAVVSESSQFKAELLNVEPTDEGLVCRVRITTSEGHSGLIYGPLRVHSGLRSEAITVIGTVR